MEEVFNGIFGLHQGQTPMKVVELPSLKSWLDKALRAPCSNFGIKPGLNRKLHYMAAEVPSKCILYLILCLTFRHFVTPFISHWQCFAIPTFCFPSYTGLISVSGLPSPPSFHPLSPLLSHWARRAC